MLSDVSHATAATATVVIIALQPQASNTPVCSSGKQGLSPFWAFLHK